MQYVFNNNTILSHMIAKMIDEDASIQKTLFFMKGQLNILKIFRFGLKLSLLSSKKIFKLCYHLELHLSF